MSEQYPSREHLRDARILVVLTTLELGGSERQAIHLASYLQDECQARVAVVALFGGLGSQPVRQMCVQRRLPCLRVNMPEHNSGVPTFRSIRQFARDLSFLQPDILLPYTTLPNVLCGIVWKIAGARACIWNQRDEGIELTSSRWHTLALKSSSRFIANSRAGATILAAKYSVPSAKIDVVCNGVELPPPLQSRDEFRKSIGLSDSTFVAAMIANITRHKDHATLVRAWRIVCDRLPDLNPQLLLAGREDDASELKRLIAALNLDRHVRLLGPVADVSSLLHAADLAVFSSRSEGLPNGVLEAMAAGLAVVATDIPGCRDALGQHYPALAAAGDADAMAERIITMAKNAELRKETGAALMERAREMYSVDAMCERSCQFILRAIS